MSFQVQYENKFSLIWLWRTLRGNKKLMFWENDWRANSREMPGFDFEMSFNPRRLLKRFFLFFFVFPLIQLKQKWSRDDQFHDLVISCRLRYFFTRRLQV